MQVGVMFPQNEIGTDVDDIRAFVAAAVGAGCQHVWATDHVVGAGTRTRPDWDAPYTWRHEFHEPLVLFAFLAGICELELVTGILVLPQRQTVLVAKQAAEVDLLSRGRLRLGVGVGWNPVEYEALGADFGDRGRRIEEQIRLLRRLWTQPLVTVDGEFDVVHDAGITPLPVQRPIPIWLGAGASMSGLRRVGRVADGYLAQAIPGPDSALPDHLDVIRAAARAAGRDDTALGLQGLLPVHGRSDAQLRETAQRWRDLGATHITVDPRAVSLHVDQNLSMEDKLARRRAAMPALVENLQRGVAAVAGA